MGRRTIGTCLAAALLVATGGGARAGDKAEKPPPFQRGPDFQKRVDTAIAKGVAWLRSVQQKDGRFTRFANDIEDTALACHALRVSKVAIDDPAFAAAFAGIRALYEHEKQTLKSIRSQIGFGTEDSALMCVAIADHGVWNVVDPSTSEVSISLCAEDRAWMTELTRSLEQTQKQNGSWPQYSDDVSGSFDFGFTYKSMLALKAASRSAIRVKVAVWERTLEYLLRTQEPRSWPASPDTKSAGRPRGWELARLGSQKPDPDAWDTANAIAALTICESELLADPRAKSQPHAKVEAAIRDGLAFLAVNNWVLDRFRDGTVQFQSMEYEAAYAMERALDLTGVEQLGSRDWYGELATYLTAAQSPTGGWRGIDRDPGDDKDLLQMHDVEATCFALIVLGRGTPRVQWTITVLDDSDIRFDATPTLSDKDFADFLDLVLSRWRRIDDSGVKARLFAKTTAVGPRIVAPLIKRLSSDKDEDRAAAFALLKRATGLDHGYDPSAKPDARDAAVAAWATWWTANEKTLRYDAASGRLVAGTSDK